MVCINCKKLVPDNSAYCMYCGSPVFRQNTQPKNNAPTPQEQPVPAPVRETAAIPVTASVAQSSRAELDFQDIPADGGFSFHVETDDTFSEPMPAPEEVIDLAHPDFSDIPEPVTSEPVKQPVKVVPKKVTAHRVIAPKPPAAPEPEPPPSPAPSASAPPRLIKARPFDPKAFDSSSFDIDDIDFSFDDPDGESLDRFKPLSDEIDETFPHIEVPDISLFAKASYADNLSKAAVNEDPLSFAEPVFSDPQDFVLPDFAPSLPDPPIFIADDPVHEPEPTPADTSAIHAGQTFLADDEAAAPNRSLDFIPEDSFPITCSDSLDVVSDPKQNEAVALAAESHPSPQPDPPRGKSIACADSAAEASQPPSETSSTGFVLVPESSVQTESLSPQAQSNPPPELQAVADDAFPAEGFSSGLNEPATIPPAISKTTAPHPTPTTVKEDLWPDQFEKTPAKFPKWLIAVILLLVAALGVIVYFLLSPYLGSNTDNPSSVSAAYSEQDLLAAEYAHEIIRASARYPDSMQFDEDTLQIDRDVSDYVIRQQFNWMNSSGEDLRSEYVVVLALEPSDRKAYTPYKVTIDDDVILEP